LVASITATPSCVGSNTGTVTASGAGGQSCQAYSYLWSNGATTSSLSGLAPGSYHLTLTDAAGCSDTASATVTAWPVGSVAITQNLGALVATPGFTAYQWNSSVGPIPGATSGQFTPLASGLYTVVATDSNGCAWTSAVFPFTYVAVVPSLHGDPGITLHPNPNTGVFQIRMAAPLVGPVEVAAFDLRGRRVHGETLAALGSGHAFDLSGLAAGSYVLTIQSAGGLPFRLRFVRE
jgi:Secretion system C-terminal sorting domain